MLLKTEAQTHRLIPDWSQELHFILVFVELFQWPVLLLSILGMYNGEPLTHSPIR